MAITLGTGYNSGNDANSTGVTFSATMAANTKCIVVVVTGYDSSATDSVVSSVTFNGDSLSQIAGGRYRVGSDFQDIWYLPLPDIATGNVVVTMAGTCTDLQATAIGLIDSTATLITYDNYDTGTGSGSASAVVSAAKTGSVAVGGGVAVGGTAGSLSITAGTEISGSEVDMGSQTASCGTASESGGSATITWTYSGVVCTALAATFYSQFAPTVTLEDPTAGETVTDTTPPLLFTGTDANADEVEYEVQVDTSADFNSVAGSTLLWQRNNYSAYDDLSDESGDYDGVGQSFLPARSGVLDKVAFWLLKVGSPTGNATVSIYATTGTFNSDEVISGSPLASMSLDVSSLTSTGTKTYITFTGANKITLQQDVCYYATIMWSSGDSSNLNVGKAKLTKFSHYLGVFVEPSCHSKRPSKGNSKNLNT
jgi:hypothetical protein